MQGASIKEGAESRIPAPSLLQAAPSNEMDFGVSSVIKLIGNGISLVKAIWKMINSFKELQEERGGMQRQITVLKSVLESINKVDTVHDPSVARELQTSLKNLEVILNEAIEALASLNFKEAMKALKSFEGKDEKFLKRIIKKLKQAKEVAELAFAAESKEKVLILLDKRLKLALFIVQIGFSCTQVRQVRRIGVRLTADFHDLNFVTDDTQEVYTDPYGVVPADSVTNVKAEVSSQRLIVKWDSSDSPEGTKYEIKYHDTKHLTVICNGSPVALGSQRIQPWKNYAIQIRAVNNAGASPWSYPPVYVRMNQGAPNSPSFLIVESITKTSLMVSTEKPPKEQSVTHIIVEYCKIEKKEGDSDIMQWQNVECDINDKDDYMIHGLESTTEYFIRVRYRNQFDVSEPSAPVAVKIEDMLPSEPTDLKLVRFSRPPKIQFKPPSVNRGAVQKYVIKIKEVSKTRDKEATKVSLKTFLFEIDGNQEPDRQSGLLSQPLDMTIENTIRYDMVVRAIAKKGVTETTGSLEGRPSYGYSGAVEERVEVLRVFEPEVSTEFSDFDIY